jgi:hypothetical protein
MFKEYKSFLCLTKSLFETIAERTAFIDLDLYLVPFVFLKESISENISS